MSKNAITYGEVSLAAETLKKQGILPTAENVRNQLVVHADLETIEQFLNEWQSKLDNPNLEVLPFSSQDELAADDTARLADNAKVIIQKHMEELRQSLALVRSTLESTVDGIMMLSNEGKLIDWNQKFVELWRIPKELMDKRDANAGVQFVFEQLEDPDFVFKQIAHLYEHPEISGDMGNVTLKDGRIIERYSQPHIVDGNIIGRVWSFRDITKRHRMTEALRLRQRAIEASSHGVIITDVSSGHKAIYVNPAFSKIAGYAEEEVLGNDYHVFIATYDNDIPKKSLEKALTHYSSSTIEFRNYKKDGTAYWNEIHIAPVPNSEGKVNHYVWIINDVTVRKNMETQLSHQATHDYLTHLPNRLLLADRVEQAIVHAKRDNQLFALLFLDLDSFKLINDTLGHQLGDLLLIQVANRIKTVLREVDTISRVGGDEFVIIIQYIDKYEDVKSIIEKILGLFNKKFVIQDHEINITGSIGISFYPKDGDSFEALYKNADISMYEAKAIGRDTYQFYTEKLDKDIKHRMAIENSVPKALKKNEFLLHYQPIIDVGKRKVISLEALIRWQHPELGFIAPDKFIDIIENSYHITPVTEWVVNTACKQLYKLHQMGYDDLSISVNISGKHLIQTDLITLVQKAIRKTKIDPHYLELEITENILVNDTEKALNILELISKLGIRFVIDDFGTGYSSLNYLRLFPVSALKIDRSFVSEIDSSASVNTITLINAIIAIAKSLNIKVVAEGIETEEQLAYLTNQGCHNIQGYYFSKPLPEDQVANFLKEFK